MSNIPSYDPDPIDFQLDTWNGIGSAGQDASDYANPVAVSLLIDQMRVQLTQMKVSRSEINELRSKLTISTDENKHLSVEVARLETLNNISLAQIAIGIITGFSINILTNDIKNGVGWFLLFISIVILLLLWNNNKRKQK